MMTPLYHITRKLLLVLLLGAALTEGDSVSLRLCVAVSVLSCGGSAPAFSCAALHPAPMGYAVYFLLCGKWMSLP